METLLLQFIETLDRTLKKGRGSAGNLPGILNLTVSQLQYLDAIAELEPATVTTVAERLQVTKPSATTAVSRLIEQGYVRKTPSNSDGRVHYLELTAEGKKLAHLKELAARDYQTFIQSVLTPQELAAFEAALQKLVNQYHQHHRQEDSK
jgi:MarR family transcriptional regulator for hemolysin